MNLLSTALRIFLTLVFLPTILFALAPPATIAAATASQKVNRLSSSSSFSVRTIMSAVRNQDSDSNGDQEDSVASAGAPHPFCLLPGDPSLILTTNVDLGAKKMEIMKACSKAISEHTGKPEAYVAVSITDKADVIFGGTDEPTALGCLYSIGSIAQESNGAITAAVSDLLLQHNNIDPARIYINFFDMPRANVGWSKRTFAG